jgi:hypothetical protein
MSHATSVPSPHSRGSATGMVGGTVILVGLLLALIFMYQGCKDRNERKRVAEAAQAAVATQAAPAPATTDRRWVIEPVLYEFKNEPGGCLVIRLATARWEAVGGPMQVTLPSGETHDESPGQPAPPTISRTRRSGMFSFCSKSPDKGGGVRIWAQ